MARAAWFTNGFRLATDLWDPSHRYETSWILPPWLLFAIRLLIGLYILVTRFFIIGWSCTHESEGGCTSVVNSFSFFTVLTFWGLGFYFIVAAIHTGTYAFRGRPLLDSFPRILQALHGLYYTTICTMPLLVTVVYWAILSDSRERSVFSNWSNISQHAANSAFALFEIIIPRTSHEQLLLVHMLWLVIILALYLSLAYLTEATRGFYPYPFLDPEENGRGVLAGYILGIAVASIIFFWIAKGLVWLRQWLTERKMGMDGKFAGQPTYDSYDTEMGTVTRREKSNGTK